MAEDVVRHEELGQLQALANGIVEQVGLVVRGRREVAELAVVVLLAEGHLLLEDVPGVGKTTLAKALAAAVDCTLGRIQFTPDLMPSDLIGTHLYQAAKGEFAFVPGPVFANIVIADEINRASPKTQSALLQAMQEGQVTVDTSTYRLPRPFAVIATQNPIEMAGTYPLPEAQRDRFMARISVGYPSAEQEQAMLSDQETADPLDRVVPAATAGQINTAVQAVRRIHTAKAVKDYITRLAIATRAWPDLALGASPRASLHLLRAAKALAVLRGREFVVPDDVQKLLQPLWAHRLVLNQQARGAGRTAGQVLADVVTRVPVQ
ncbi:MAG: MoxR family ATPase [Propionibacteriaceae bacterium]|jgi:MoxR-like ATPase|nr:MoxR family ATPase [Propionibacteriaceae bacterium]